MTVLTYVLALIVTLGVLVTVHELGHYCVARMSGVRILRFAVGFGKPIWSKTDALGTEWALAAIPLGGYVRMLGENENGTGLEPVGEGVAANDVSYDMLHPRWRIAIALGGPFANFALAIAVYWLLALAGTTTLTPVLGAVPLDSPVAQAGLEEHLEIVSVDGTQTRTWSEINMALAGRLGDNGDIVIGARPLGSDRVRDYRVAIQDWHRGVDEPDLMGSLGINPGTPAIVAQVVENSAADRAGLKAWDRMVAINDQPIGDWGEFSQLITSFPDQEVTIVVDRAGQELMLSATPEGRDVEGQRLGFLGVARPISEVRSGPIDAVGVGVAKTLGTVELTLGLLKKMVFGQVSVANLSGPITIAKVAGDSARVGWKYFLGVLALLSVSLGILNLLPIPVLDGGHVVFASMEWISGKPVSERVVEVGYQLGMFVVAGLMVLALYNDVARLVAG